MVTITLFFFGIIIGYFLGYKYSKNNKLLKTDKFVEYHGNGHYTIGYEKPLNPNYKPPIVKGKDPNK